MNIKQTDTQHSLALAAMRATDYLMIPDEPVLRALHNSRLMANLRDFEVSVFASLLTIQYFEVSELIAELDDSLKDVLMILVEGDLEVNATVGNESVMLHSKHLATWPESSAL